MEIAGHQSATETTDDTSAIRRSEVEALAHAVADVGPTRPAHGAPVHPVSTTAGSTAALPRPLLVDLADAPPADVQRPDAAGAVPPPDPADDSDHGRDDAPRGDATGHDPASADEPDDRAGSGDVAHHGPSGRASGHRDADPTFPLDRLTPGESFGLPVPGTSIPPPPTPAPLGRAAPDPLRASPAAHATVFDGVSDTHRLAVLESLPVAVLFIDTIGLIHYLNRQAIELVGLSGDAVHGRNLLDFVHVDDLDFVAAMFTHGPNPSGSVTGPIRVRYVDEWSVTHWTQVWSSVAPSDLDVEGFVLTLSPETAIDVLTAGFSGLASAPALDDTLAIVAASVHRHPFSGRGAILIAEASDEDHDDPDGDAADDADRGPTAFRMIGTWPIDMGSISADGTPWRTAFETGRACDVDDVGDSRLPRRARQVLHDADVGSIVARPILDGDGVALGVLVVFDSVVGEMSPNQNRHLETAVQFTAVVVGQHLRHRRLVRAVHRDALTGVLNRAAFVRRLENERRATDVLFVDLDAFKEINDSYGHHAGDQVLAETARRLTETVRDGGDVFRTGGDEFVVLLGALGDDDARTRLAERIVARIAEPVTVDGVEIRTGAAVGIAAAGHGSLNDTVRSADRALYEAKRSPHLSWSHETD